MTVIASTYDGRGEPRSKVLLGIGKGSRHIVDFPEDGIYLVYKDRALQVAGSQCTNRKCNWVCYCDKDRLPTTPCDPPTHRTLKSIASDWTTWKPCNDCLFRWLCLYQVVEKSYPFQLLAYPRTLTWTSSLGYDAFQYDDEWEDLSEHYYVRSTYNGRRQTMSDDPTSVRVFNWMLEAWVDFVKMGGYKGASVKSVSESDPNVTALSDTDFDVISEYTESIGDIVSIKDDESDSRRIQIATPPSSHHEAEDDDFDHIDDVIEEEFPILHEKEIARKKKAARNKKVANNERNDHGEDPPAIIPPKDMAVGRGFRPTSQDTKPQTRPGQKRQHRDLDVNDDASRAKQRKREYDVSSWIKSGRRPYPNTTRAQDIVESWRQSNTRR